MTIKQLINYKHSLFTVEPLNTEDVELIKSKVFGYTFYVVRNNNLLAVLDSSSLADNSRTLWYALKGEHKPSQNDVEMYQEG